MTDNTDTQDPADAPQLDEGDGAAEHRSGLGVGRIVVLVLAVAFLASALTWSVMTLRHDPLSDTDVGFMQDMGLHHEQAVKLSLLLLDKKNIDSSLRSFAQEIIIDQRYEQGIFNATLDRFDHSSAAGEEVMGWMGDPVPAAQMEGLATPAQIAELRKAEGDDAAALWIALMTEHHLGGLHMADWAARHGSDTTTRNLAKAMVRNQRSEVIDMDRYRRNAGLPIPEGFDDPLKDQRLNPISFTSGD